MAFRFPHRLPPAANAAATNAIAIAAPSVEGTSKRRRPTFSQSGSEITMPSPCASASAAVSATDWFSLKPHAMRIDAP